MDTSVDWGSGQSVDSNRLEKAIDDFNRICSQLPQNGSNDWLQSFYRLMRSEWTRLRSFTTRHNAKWTTDFVTPEELASAGFFFLYDDRVQCPFCKGIVYNWQRGDRPLEEHARHYPRCPFIMEEDVGNEPITNDPRIAYRNRLTEDHNPFGNSISVETNGYNQSYADIDIKQLGLRPHLSSKHSDYVSIDSRRRSYALNGWDTRVPVSVDSLADAGFFAIGDYVKCFHCSGGLYDWEFGDDPWIEHTKWFPDCLFVQLNKSQAFVDACKRLAQKQRQDTLKPNSEMSDIVNKDNDSICITTVNEWMNSDIVKLLIELNAFSAEYVKEVLNHRWKQTREPFASFSELYDAVSQPEGRPSIQSLVSNQTNEELHCSSDHQLVGRSPQSSLSSISSALSSLSISAESSQEIKTSKLSGNLKDDQIVCKICYDREIGVVFIPCGHQLACTQCAVGFNDCPVCRTAIRFNLRTFFA